MEAQIKILGSVSPYCKDRCNGPGYLIMTTNNKILLECGAGITRNMKFPEDLEGLSIFISHLHKDHYSELFSIGYASYVYHNMGLVKKKIKVYIPKLSENRDQLNCDYQILYSMKEQYFEFIEYNLESVFFYDNAKISFCQTAHEIDCFAIKIQYKDKKLVYTGDTGYALSPKFFEFCKNADCFLCEASLLKKQHIQNSNHLTAEEAALLAKKLNVKKMVLTHFWPEIDKGEYLSEASIIFPNTIVAEELNIIKI